MVKCFRKSVSFSDIWVSSSDKWSDFYASSWQRGESPLPLLILRLVLAMVSVSILAWSVSEAPVPHWLVYLTNWGLILVTLMTLSGLLVSVIAICNNISGSGELPFYISMYWLFYNIAVSFAVMITALYWILLYSPEGYEGEDRRVFWLDVATHGINSCVAVMEVLMSRTPMIFLHVYQPLGVALWYAAFTAIYYVSGGTDGDGNPYIYELLDWRKGKRTSIVVGASAVGLIVVYVIIWGVALCRDKLSANLLRTTSHDLPPTPPDRHMGNSV